MQEGILGDIYDGRIWNELRSINDRQFLPFIIIYA